MILEIQWLSSSFSQRFDEKPVRSAGPEIFLGSGWGWITTEDIDVGGLEHGWIIFPYVGNNNPHHFSEG